MLAVQPLPKSKADVLPIYAVTPFTMLDFPSKTACIVWFSGCNMRCGYCHNPQIVKGRGRFERERFLAFLEMRRGLLDGVVLSGGEATLYPGIIEFAAKVKDMGFAVKLDTNGTRPDVIKTLLTKGSLDYVALDYKAPRTKFARVTHCTEIDAFAESLSVLTTQTAVPYEIRTTVHTDLLNEQDINVIITDLEANYYRGTYFVQNFVFNKDRPTLNKMPAQTWPLDQNKILIPKEFRVEYRNF